MILETIILLCPKCYNQMWRELSVGKKDWQKHFCASCEIEILIKVIDDKVIFKTIEES